MNAIDNRLYRLFHAALTLYPVPPRGSLYIAWVKECLNEPTMYLGGDRLSQNIYLQSMEYLTMIRGMV